MRYFYRFLFLTIALCFNQLYCQQSTGDDSVSFNPNIQPVINISRCQNGAVKIDGKLDEEAWKNAPAAKDFVEIEPGDNLEPPVKTEVLIMFDDDNLYFGFICYDNEMKKLVSNLCDRDKMFSDDWVGPIIDPYGDNKKGYEIFVNPYGVQGDLIWTKQGENSSYDMIFYSEASIHKDKWIVEMAIPFKSLSFPDKNNHDWKIHLLRTRPRDTRTQMSWAKISRDDPSFLGQAGILKGINKVKGGKNFEILPYVLGGLTGYRRDINNPDSKFVADSVKKGEFGVGLKYGFTSNLTGEVVYNPDFSQIESDAAKVDVNSSSALFYPEKRPFFLEGSDIFNSYVDVVYTRMINDPLLALKLTGKIGSLDVGYVGAYDEKTQFILPFDYGSDFVFSDSLRSLSNTLRLRRSLKGDSYIGVIATDREVKKSYNRVIGFDGSLNFWNDMYLNWEGLYYSTKEINDPDIYSSDIRFGRNKEYSLTFDGESFSGFGAFVELQKRTRNYGGGLSYSQAPPEARRDLGFISNNNFRTLSTWNYYTMYPENSFFLRIEPQLNAGIRYDFNNRIREQWLVPGFWFLFKKQINMSGGFFAVNNEEYEGIFHKNVNRGWVNINVNTFNKAAGGAYFELGRYIVRFENPSFVGYGYYAETWMDLRPVDRLISSFSYVYTELSKKAGEEKLYAGYIFRNKTSFQFNKHLFLRCIVQYDSFNKRLDIDPLLSYKWNPFTIFYIGSTHEVDSYDDGHNKSRLVETG
ncbi:MAG TPA: DUF5916 domain-containing protein, partial [Ignavibacteria bacterium]